MKYFHIVEIKIRYDIRYWTLLWVLILHICFLTGTALSQTKDFPGKTWKQYLAPDEAGYSTEKLEHAREIFAKSDAASVMVIHDGRVLVSWGETTRRFRCASMRKSLLNSLYGIYVGTNKIKLSETLEDLGIDDIQGLSNEEKQAKVVDLLSSRSGVYHPAAFSPRRMERNLPARGSHPPGTFWFYNNWDFNTLATIFEKKIGKTVFETFKKEIANPLKMEDFQIWNTHYRNEKNKSMHPAYLFRMTARDLARFGLLYLNNGTWQNKHIVPAAWVKKSTNAISIELGRFSERGSYGYLWWVSKGINGEPMYFASGSGGQRLCILPDSKLVFVHMVNTYDNNNVGHSKVMSLLASILDSKVSQPKDRPQLLKYDPPKTRKPEPAETEVRNLKKLVGTYNHLILGKLTVTLRKKNLVLGTGIGMFKLISVGNDKFIPEDIETPILFRKTEEDKKRYTAVSVYDENRKLNRIVFNY